MNAHEVLGVASDASPEAIKAAYKRLAMKYHPDRGGDVAKFQEVKTAYETLQKCPHCNGVGRLKVREGYFTKTVKCPLCWQK